MEFETLVEEAIASVPEPLARFMENVGVIVDEQAPPWQSVLGLYQGIPLTRRNTAYAGALPDKITIFRHRSSASTGPTRTACATASATSSCTRSPTTSASRTSGCASSASTSSPPSDADRPWPPTG